MKNSRTTAHNILITLFFFNSAFSVLVRRNMLGLLDPVDMLTEFWAVFVLNIILLLLLNDDPVRATSMWVQPLAVSPCPVKKIETFSAVLV